MTPILNERDAAKHLGMGWRKLAELRRAGIVQPSHNLNPGGVRPRPGYSETCLAAIRAQLQWTPKEEMAEGAK